MSRILVTGGAGMIGSTLVKRLVAAGHDVRVVDDLSRGKKEFLLDTAGRPAIDLERNLIVRDLSVTGALDDLLDGVDYIYHLADVVAGVDYVFKHQGEVFRQNLLINSNTVASMRKGRLKGAVYVGTACSFPAELQTGTDAAPLREEQQYPANPESGYGWSKLMGEYEMFLFEKECGVPVSVLSLHNVYGEPCEFGERTSQVIPSLIRKSIRYPQEPFIVWGSGAQGRAFVHVDDVVDALELSISKGLGQGVIQIGPSSCTSIKELAEQIVKVSGKDIVLQFDTTKPEGDRGRCADYSKAKRILGWEPRVTLEDGLRRLYQWTQAQMGK